MNNVKFCGPVYGLEVLEICSHKVSASLGRPYSIIDIHHAGVSAMSTHQF